MSSVLLFLAFVDCIFPARMTFQDTFVLIPDSLVFASHSYILKPPLIQALGWEHRKIILKKKKLMIVGKGSGQTKYDY